MLNTPSSIEDLNNAIKDQNPFDRSLVVKQAEIWDKSFPDCPTINAHASDAVLSEIKKVLCGKKQSSVGLTITAERGLGKSHIISRIRHHLQLESGALFVYMADFSDLKRLNSIFLQTLVFSLKKEGSQKVSQWQELATEIINNAYDENYKALSLLNEFPKVLSRNLAKGIKAVDFISGMRNKFVEAKSDITDNPYLIQAVLWTLSKPHANFAQSWLCGKVLAQAQSEEMGLPNSSKELDEASAFSSICQILDLIGAYRTLVICFDELDGVSGDSDSIFTKAQIVASFIKNVYDLTKKGVFLTVMYPQTWRDQIRTMPQAEAVTDRIGEKVLDLLYLNPNDVVNLVTIWMKDFYEQQNLTPIYPLYPFKEAELRELGKEKLIVRRVLQWCKDNFQAPDPGTVKKHPVENAYNEQLNGLEASIDTYIEDKFSVAEALFLCFSSLVNQTINGIRIDSVEKFRSSASERGYSPDFKIVGFENGNHVRIGVMVLQISTGQGVQAGLKKLIDYGKLNITRGCLVRSKAISPGAAKANSYLRELIDQKNGKKADLKEQDIKPLLAILLVSNSKDDYELSNEQIFDFMNSQLLITDNPLIQAILSAS